MSEEGVQTMNVRCPSCRTVFRVDPAKVPEAGVRARCAVCAATIDVRRDGAAMPRPAGAEPARIPAAAVAPPPAPAPVPAPPPPTPEPSPAVAARAPRLSQPFVAPRGAAPPAPTPAPAPAAAAERVAAAAPVTRPSAPVFRPTPGQPVTVPPPRPAAAPPAAASAPPAAVPRAPTPPPAAPKPAAAPTEATAVRAINPFLQKDPKQKARRLARALVSDMIVYQPAKRQRALAAGTLKTEFDEEIQKSWEEYVEQVGEELATSTPYWQEALNDILAGGQQLF